MCVPEIRAAFGDFEGPPRAEVGVCLGEEIGPIQHTACELADVDEVEIVERVRPLVAGVVDLEDYVWGHPGGLHGGEICPVDFGVGEEIACFHGPDSGAGADVEDAFGVVELG